MPTSKTPFQLYMKTDLRLERMKRVLNRNLYSNLDQAAILVKTSAKTLLSGPPRSSPYNPPGRVTGNLRNSINVERPSATVRTIGPTGGSTTRGTPVKKYGYFLEFGTRRMAPRPYMRPSLALVVQKFRSIFRKLI